MSYFIRAGGWPMLIILALGGIALYLGVRQMINATARRRHLLDTLGKATRYTAIGGVASNLTATAWNSVDCCIDSPELAEALLTGIGESLTVITAAYSMLGFAWIMATVGARRATDVEPA